MSIFVARPLLMRALPKCQQCYRNQTLQLYSQLRGHNKCYKANVYAVYRKYGIHICIGTFGIVSSFRVLRTRCEGVASRQVVAQVELNINNSAKFVSKKVTKTTTIYEKLYNSLMETIFTILRGLRLTLTFTPVLFLYPFTYIGPKCTDLWFRYFLYTVEHSGATFIKIGQWASTRRDLFPDEFCDRFSKLQHKAPPHDWRHTKQRLQRAFGKNWRKILVRFESKTPVGSGAVAQTYKAYMKPDMIADEEVLEEILQDLDDSETDISPYEILGFRQMFKRHDKSDNDDDDDDNDIECTHSEGSDPCEGLVPVCVKVLHPGIYTEVKRDLRLLHCMARFTEVCLPRFRWLSLTECVDEFGNMMLKQVDLKKEADNLETFFVNFEDNPNIRFARPVRPYVKRDVLVETWEDADHISNFIMENTGDNDGQNLDTIRVKLASYGIDALLQMIFHDNFVHGDLHPGNLMVQNAEHYKPEDETKLSIVDLMDTVVVNVKPTDTPLRLVFVDVGISLSLGEEDRKNFKKVFTSVVVGDGERVADLMLKHSKHNECKNVDKFREDMALLVNEARQVSLQLGKFQVQELLGKVFRLLTQHKVKMESNFVSVIIAIMILEGLGRSLDPELDILERAKPILLGGYQ